MNLKKIIKWILVIILVLFGIYFCVAVKYIIITEHKTSREGTVSRNADVMDIENPRIFLRKKTLFSENGKVLDGFIDDEYGIDFSESYDHTKAALVKDAGENYNVYFVDGNLEPELVCENSSRHAFLAKDGGYIAYSTRSGTSMYVYDVAKKESILISDKGVDPYYFAISSNGKYVAYYDYTLSKTVIYDVENGDTKATFDKRYNALAISRDGERGFFFEYDDSICILYTYRNNEIEVIGPIDHFQCMINDDCTDIFYYDYTSEMWYYNQNMEGPRKMLDAGPSDFHCESDVVGREAKYSDVYLVDVPNLGNCYFRADSEYYYFHGENDVVHKLNYGMYGEYSKLSDGKLYLLQLNDHVISYISTDGELEYGEPTPEISEQVDDFAANDDLSIIWYTDRSGRLYKYQNDKSTLIYHKEEGGRLGNIYYSSIEKKLYFLEIDNVLASVSDYSDEIVREYDGCNYLYGYDYFYYNGFAYFDTLEGNSFIKIFGNLVDLGR